METRGRKKRRVEDVCSQDEFVDLEGSQSDDVVCSQYANDDSFLNKSSSDVELFSVVSYIFNLFVSVDLFYIFVLKLFFLFLFFRILHLMIQVLKGLTKLCIKSV